MFSFLFICNIKTIAKFYASFVKNIIIPPVWSVCRIKFCQASGGKNTFPFPMLAVINIFIRKIYYYSAVPDINIGIESSACSLQTIESLTKTLFSGWIFYSGILMWSAKIIHKIRHNL